MSAARLALRAALLLAPLAWVACSDAESAESGSGGAATMNDAEAGYTGAGGALATGTDSTGGITGTHRADDTAPDKTAAPGGEDPTIAPGCVDLAKASGMAAHAYVESSDDSNSMGSPVIARQLLRAGKAPVPSTIRAWEFLNYYHVGYAPPASPGDLVAVHAGARVSGASVELQVGVRALSAPEVRRPMTLTLVLDNSGSMAGEGIARERALVKAVAKKLVAHDIVSVLTWSLKESKILEHHVVKGPDDPKVLGVADALRASGGSDLHAALTTAYEVAREGFDSTRLNRVVLVSDGGANLGVTDSRAIAAAAAAADTTELYLTGVGTGPAEGYSDALMNAVTDAGRGAYVYLDSDDEAAHMFGDRFDEVMSIAARSVRVTLDVPWYLTIERFDGEGYSPNPADIEPQHLAPGGEMVLHQTLVSCAATQISDDDEVAVHVSWQTRAGSLDRTSIDPLTMRLGDLKVQGQRDVSKGAAIVHYADALTLEGGAAHAALVAVHAELAALSKRADLAGDVELAEIDELVQKHPRFAGN